MIYYKGDLYIWGAVKAVIRLFISWFARRLTKWQKDMTKQEKNEPKQKNTHQVMRPEYNWIDPQNINKRKQTKYDELFLKNLSKWAHDVLNGGTSRIKKTYWD